MKSNVRYQPAAAARAPGLIILWEPFAPPMVSSLLPTLARGASADASRKADCKESAND